MEFDVKTLEDIRTYLVVFAKSLGVEVEPYDDIVDQISDQIMARMALDLKEFDQIIPKTCRKCKVAYREQGTKSQNDYMYCGFRGDPNNVRGACPKMIRKYGSAWLGMGEGDIIEEIRNTRQQKFSIKSKDERGKA